MSHTPHKPLPEGCDQQSRYSTRRAQLVDVMPRRASDSVIDCYSNGQPKAGEACPDDDDPPRNQTDAVLIALMWALSALLALIVVGSLIAWAWPTVRGWL